MRSPTTKAVNDSYMNSMTLLNNVEEILKTHSGYFKKLLLLNVKMRMTTDI